MFLADRHVDRLQGYTWVILCLALVFAAILYWRALSLPGPYSAAGESHEVQLAWAGAQNPGGIDWSILCSGDGLPRAGAGSLATSFRLAGTFFSYAGGTKDQRKAVLDSIKTGTQTIVQENEAIEGITVLKIHHDRVVLRSDSGKEEELWLGFTQKTADHAGAGGAADDQPDPAAIRTGMTRFGGKQVGRNSWIFQRGPLLEYYDELRAEPSRLYAVFESMHPIYGEGRQIFGYQLQIEGEKEFFEAAGLHEGDIVRKVNSVMMNNRRSAEHFISQFIEGEANVFLLDIERNGQPARLSYQMR